MAVFACAIDDIPDGGVKSLVLQGRRIALARIGRDVFALDDRCPHWGGPLGAGTISVARREIVCPWHRFRFDLASGACVASNLRKPAQRHAVTIDGTRVLVDIPAQAEPAPQTRGNVR